MAHVSWTSCRISGFDSSRTRQREMETDAESMLSTHIGEEGGGTWLTALSRLLGSLACTSC
jgi:hypothetical protein